MRTGGRGIRGTTVGIEEAALRLRARTTIAEQVLWTALRGRRVGGTKWRRQHPVGPFVLDFYCPEHRLVIEVDGPVHDETVESDALRTVHLATYGYRVLRVQNDDVIHRLDDVLASIHDAIAARTTATARTGQQPSNSSPSPERRERGSGGEGQPCA